MANKNYKLTFKMSDGTEQEVHFTVPQGEKGDKGDPGSTGVAGSNGVGITEITIAEV